MIHLCSDEIQAAATLLPRIWECICFAWRWLRRG